MTQNHEPNARTAAIQARLSEMTAELSGYEAADLVPTQTFLELGFDSLFLTQLATAFQKEFGVKVTFRQLFDEVPTLAALAGHLDAQLPADAIADESQAAPSPAPAAASPAAPDSAAAPETGTQTASDLAQKSAALMPVELPALSGSAAPQGMAAIFREQIRLMTAQLQMLQQARAGQNPSGATVSMPAAETPAAANAPVAAGEAAAEDPAPQSPPQMPKGFGPTQSTELNEKTLSPRQRDHIERLVARYNSKTRVSKRRTQEDRVHHADPRTAAGFNPIWKEMVYPLVVERSKGAHLWDADGNRYIDMLNGFGPNFFGHNAPFITGALRAQLDDSYEVGPQTPRAGEAAKLLCELTGMDRVSWVNTGSEAVQAAIRISRTVTGRDKIVVFAGDYHGNFDEVLVRGTKSAKGRRTFPLAPGIPFDSVGNVIVLDYGDMASLEEIRAQAADIAAVLVEPIQSRKPELQPREFLHALRDLTRDEEIVLVFDEVITGFRTCPGGAQEYFGVDADLATYGKIIGGGMPIGVVAGRARFMDTFDGGQWQYGDASKPTAGVTFFAGTFVRHPLAIAAAHASLSYLKSAGPSLQQEVNRKAERLATTLTAFFAEQGVNFEVPHFASQMFIRNNEESELATLFFYHMRDHGVHLLEGFPTYMTAAHTDEDIDAVIAAAKESIREMQADGILAVPEGIDVPFRRQCELTDAQRHTWLACQMGEAANCAFNESDSILIAGELDLEKFRDAVLDTLDHHEAFRLRFDDDGEFQWVDPAMTFALDEIDLSRGADRDRGKDLEAFFARAAQTPFDLAEGPLVRPHLLSIGRSRYIFALYCHHLIFDGYSAELVISEIVTRYNAALADTPPDLGTTSPFSVYASLAAGDGHEAALDHWKSVFADGVPPLLDLPTDQPRQAERQYGGGTVHRELDPALSARVSSAAKSLGVSQHALLYAAFAALLSRLAAQEDFVIAVPAAGQAHRERETVGFCVNMLPVRLQPGDDLEFADFARAAQKSVLDAFEHQDFSVSDLLAATGTPRHTGRLALTETVFNFSRYFADLKLTGCKVSARENRRRAVYYDLFFNIVDSGGRLIVDFDYATSLYDEATIRRWLDHYTALLTDACLDPAQVISELSLGAGGDAGFALSGPETEIPPGPAFAGFDRAVRQHGGDPAVTCNGKVTTYAQLQAYANQLANYLTEKGVGSGDIVGILLDRSVDMVASMLAVWKSGAAYLPLDPDYPLDRLNHMVTDAGAKLVISAPEQEFLTANINATILDLSNDVAAIAGQPAELSSPPGISAADRAYVIYTSGSTGTPKGVENSHGALVNFLEAMKVSPGLTASDKLLAVTTLSFDISILEIMLPLVIGAELVLATQEEAQDGFDLCDLINDQGITVLQATPATWRLMLECDWDATPQLKALCGGEALPPALAAEILPRVGELWNMYGPTETTIWSSCAKISDADDITVGTPIDNTTVYVLDEQQRPQPTGIPGELWIGGAGVALGYIGNKKLTGDRFLKDPFTAEKKGRMYRTGDRAIITADGRIEIRGRRDNQVKLRGHRIELGEIDSVLSGHQSVSQCVTAVREDRAGEPMLTSYVVAAGEGGLNHAALRQFLRQSVPDYMVPQMFIELESLPLTGNNKVDRNALPDPVSLRLVKNERIAPRTEREREIAELWQEMLEIDDVSVTDNFFELGGQSLQVARMAALLRKTHGYRLSPRAVIFETLEQLAASVDRDRAAS